MTEKEIKKLNRQDLLILLAEQKERADRLEEQLQKAQERLEERRLLQEECGSMAEAALKFHDVFRAVDEAAAQYVENMRLRKESQEAACQKLEAESQEMSERLLSDARQEAERLAADAQEQSRQLIAQAQTEAQVKKQEAELVVQSAQERARQLVSQAEEDVRLKKQESERIVLAAQEQAGQIVAQAEEMADQQAQRAEEIILQAQAYVADEMEKIDMRWAEIHEKIEGMSKDYIWLRGIINREDDTPRQRAGEIIQDAQIRAQEIVSQAQEHAAMEMEKIDSRWNGIYDRIRGMEKEYSWLQGIINKKTGEEA